MVDCGCFVFALVLLFGVVCGVLVCLMLVDPCVCLIFTLFVVAV